MSLPELKNEKLEMEFLQEFHDLIFSINGVGFSKSMDPIFGAVNFMERPCKVHNICLRSTAQPYELYSLSELHSDNGLHCPL